MTTLDYDEDDRITRQILPNGVRQDLERDEAGRVVTIIETRLVDGVTTERRFALTYETGDRTFARITTTGGSNSTTRRTSTVMAVRDSWNGETRYRRGDGTTSRRSRKPGGHSSCRGPTATTFRKCATQTECARPSRSTHLGGLSREPWLGPTDACLHTEI